MKKFILIFLSFFILAGCSTSSLQLNKGEELVLNYGSDNVVLTNEIVTKDFLNFKDLFVTIYTIKDNKQRVLFYEEAQTALDFEFNFGGLYTVMYIFDDAKEYHEVYKKNNLRLVQLKLKDSSYLNVMIHAGDIQLYSYVYGFSNKEFMELAQTLVKKDDTKLGTLTHEGIVFDNSSKPLSNWNDTVVFFAPLITPFRTLGSR